ncbi:lysophospholipid acyltransferase family protein [Magnetovibrio sp. PR-2]|uniref:lysophospholipid acyltransferase family protein n=1 Tax=Magnetovibrio sp. PR-2 TaxID=3120356 RepID=UPI002FCE3C17
MLLTTIRSIIYNLTFFIGGCVMSVVMLPTLLLSRSKVQGALAGWSGLVYWGLRNIIGLRWEVRGLENLPDEPCVFACKHQSAWETGIFYHISQDPAYILKKELLSIPLFGWYLTRSGAIAIDRKAGASALKGMVNGSKARIARGQNVVIFPEGTRSAPGKPGTYHPGVAAIYKGVDAPLVPVALNSGLFWQRRSFLKRPGVITVEILPPIEKGLDRKTFMKTLQANIEDGSNRLIDEARAIYPLALPAPKDDNGESS